jgi:hypothetical protein
VAAEAHLVGHVAGTPLRPELRAAQLGCTPSQLAVRVSDRGCLYVGAVVAVHLCCTKAAPDRLLRGDGDAPVSPLAEANVQAWKPQKPCRCPPELSNEQAEAAFGKTDPRRGDER